jgi:GLPGLI family protein
METLNKIICTAACIVASFFCNAQEVLTSGTITFECKINMHKQLEERSGEWVEMLKKQMPKYQISNYDLHFNNGSSIYKKSKEQPEQPTNNFRFMGGDDGEKNIVYKNYDSGTFVSQQFVFEKLILLQDSLPQMNWRITNEYKQFAGYNCRRATTMLFDSVFIIAYYTEALVTSSGPQSFNGLPGMIMCVHIPRTNTTYQAKKVEALVLKPEEFVAPVKGLPSTFRTITDKLTDVTKNWGKEWKNKVMWGLLM